MAIDPRLIIQMLAISKHGSISRAAEEIGVSQPALSTSIAALERQLGVRLLDRSRQGSKLTDFGVSVSRYASALDSIMSRMLDELKIKSSGSYGPLVIGATPIAAATLVPEALARILEGTPSLTVSVIEDTDDPLLELLLKGKIELSVGPVGVDAVPSAVLEEALLPDPFAVIVRQTHPLAKSRSLKLKDIIGEKWILPDHGSAYRRHIEAIFLMAGLPIPQNSVNTGSRAVIEELLLRTNRIAIMSRKLMRRANCAPLACILLADAGIPRQLGIKRLRQVQLSPPADALLALLREASVPEPDGATWQSKNSAKAARSKRHNRSR